MSRPIQLQVNGQLHALQLGPQTLLIDSLRNELGLRGTHQGCDTAQCGACTVLVDGNAVPDLQPAGLGQAGIEQQPDPDHDRVELLRPAGQLHGQSALTPGSDRRDRCRQADLDTLLLVLLKQKL